MSKTVRVYPKHVATKFSWPDIWPFHDYVLTFEVPGDASWQIIPLTRRAQRTLFVSKQTGGEHHEMTEKSHMITLTAGFRARSAGCYFGIDASKWAEEMAVEYEE